MANKKGSKKLTIFLSEEELNLVKQDLKLRDVSTHDYIIAILYNKYEYFKDSLECGFKRTTHYNKSIERNKKISLFINEEDINMISELEEYHFNASQIIADYLYESKEYIEYCIENDIDNYSDEII